MDRLELAIIFFGLWFTRSWPLPRHASPASTAAVETDHPHVVFSRPRPEEGPHAPAMRCWCHRTWPTPVRASLFPRRPPGLWGCLTNERGRRSGVRCVRSQGAGASSWRSHVGGSATRRACVPGVATPRAFARHPLCAMLAAHRGDRPLGLAPVLLLPQGLPFVVLLLALRQGDLDLRPAVLEVEGQRHDGVARLLGLGLQLVDLLAVQQQLPLAPRAVVGPGALAVLRYVDVVQPPLVVGQLDEAVHQRRPALTQRLHLGTREDQAGLVGVDDVVVVPRLLVLRDQLAPFFLSHSAAIFALSGGSGGSRLR